jgi:hypothetical protein
LSADYNLRNLASWIVSFTNIQFLRSPTLDKFLSISSQNLKLLHKSFIFNSSEVACRLHPQAYVTHAKVLYIVSLWSIKYCTCCHYKYHTITIVQWHSLCRKCRPEVPKLFRSTAPLVPYTHPQRPLPFVKKINARLFPLLFYIWNIV